MQRPIIGFHQDHEAHWVADLSCGHGQHVRHQPPFTLRPWVTTPDGRASRLGERLDCVRCDRLELPEGFVPYHKTPPFTTDSMPSHLRSAHATKAATWGRLDVLRGTLAYVVEGEPERRTTLEAGDHVFIAPEVRHRVEPLGPAEFTLELYRAERGALDSGHDSRAHDN